MPEVDIASKFNRSISFIGRVLSDDGSMEDDYSLVDEETKRLYPPRVSVIAF